MTVYSLIFYLIAIALLFSYVNFRFIKLHPTIAMMTASLIISIIVILIGSAGFHGVESIITNDVRKINFNFLLMNCMLSFLLFSGALGVELSEIKSQKWEVGILSVFTTITTAFLVGFAVYYLLDWLNVHLNFVYCMLFGSLISPTDPIAVVAIIRKIGAPKSLEVQLAGESLFNDGVGIVLFLTTLSVAFTTTHVTAMSVILLFFKEAVGGIVYGLIVGWIGCWLIKPIYNKNIIIFITIAITTGAYALAQAYDISGPLAMVVAGICIGNCPLKTDSCKEVLLGFWEIIDELLNAFLFLLIGFECLLVTFNDDVFFASIITIVIVLIIRLITVALPISLFKLKRRYFPNVISILTWGGLRGGLAVALALSIPKSAAHDIILQLTFAVVIFSILIQGTTVKSLVAHSKKIYNNKLR